MLRGTFGFQKSELGADTIKFHIINFILMITMPWFIIHFFKFIFLVFGAPYIFFLEAQELRNKKFEYQLYILNIKNELYGVHV